MTPDELNAHEEANRELVEALRRVSQDMSAPPGFLQRVMARADQLPIPQRRLWGWMWQTPLWSMSGGLRLAGAALFVLALIGAIPQYMAWINAYVMGVPTDTIYEARIQEQLWRKNFTCATQIDHTSSNYAAIMGEDLVVVTWACPSGDVLVTLESLNERAARRSVWVPLEVRQPFTQHLPRLLLSAYAEEGEQFASNQAGQIVEVLCQRWLPNGFIKRRIKLADGNCFDEIINPRTGQVIQRQKAPCDRSC